MTPSFKSKIPGLLLIVVAVASFMSGLAVGWLLKPDQQRQEIAHVRFTLDWAYQGPHAPFLLAYYKGFFAEEGLSVTIDRGYGSARVVSDVAAGVYDIGFGDINALIEFKSRNPDAKVKMVAVVYVRAPHSLVTLRGRGISEPKDLEGKRLGAPAGDAARRMFPVFARSVGVDSTKVEWVTMDIPLREPMLARGEVDAVTGFYTTIVLNLLNLNISEADIVVFKYSDYLPIVGNGVIVNEDFLKRNPEAVRRFLRALIRAIKYTIENPDEALEYVFKRDPTLNREVEKKRLRMVLEELINVRGITDKYGVGYVPLEVIQENIEVVVMGFGLERKPSVEEIVDFSYLPPVEERLP